MTTVNPGPASASTPNSIQASLVAAGTTVPYTFATLPAATNFAPGFIAITSDVGICYVTTAQTWAVLALATGGAALQRYITGDQVQLTSLTAPGQGSLSFQYLDVLWPISASRMDVLASWLAATSATAATGAVQLSMYGGIYSNSGPGTLTLLSSGSQSISWTYASNNSGSTQFTAAAIRPLSVPMNMYLVPGEYYVAFNMSTNSASVGTATTALAQSISLMGWQNNQSALNYAEFTATTNASSNFPGAQGIWSSAATGLPTSVPVTALSQTGANQSACQFAYVMRNF